MANDSTVRVGQVWQWMGSALVPKANAPDVVARMTDGGRGVVFECGGFAEVRHMMQPGSSCRLVRDAPLTPAEGRAAYDDVYGKGAPFEHNTPAVVEEVNRIALIVGRDCASEILRLTCEKARGGTAPLHAYLRAEREDLMAGRHPCPACQMATSRPRADPFGVARAFQELGAQAAKTVEGMRKTMATLLPDPRAEREARRREIDRVLAKDARRFPAFATARKCAVIAMFEDAPPVPPADLMDEVHVEQWIVNLRDYEDLRGIGRAPSAAAQRYAQGNLHDMTVTVYERARSLP